MANEKVYYNKLRDISEKHKFKEMMIELVHYRHVLFMITLKDIKIRYKQAAMGFLWAILMPMVIVAAGILVRKAFSIISGVPLNVMDVVAVSVKALPWAFFIGSIRFATNSLTSNMSLITKIYFPREIFPFSCVLAHLFDLSIASLALTVLLTVVGTGISIYLCWLPLLLIFLVLITAAVGMLLACANLFFRDVKYITEVILTFGIFFTPVFYEASAFGKWAPLLLLNPIGSILEAINNVVVLHRQPDFIWLSYCACWATLGFLLAWRIFDKAESAFAENI